MGTVEQGLDLGKERYRAVLRTLCFVQNEDAVLLLKGAPNKRIWPHLYNGLGGHVEQGEDICAAVRREIREEARLELEGLRLRALLHVSPSQDPSGIVIFVFTAFSRTRNTTPSCEGTLEWVPKARLLELDLVEDLRILLPKLLPGSPRDPVLVALYTYDQDGRLVVRFAPEA